VKKAYRVTYRYDKKTNNFRLYLIKKINEKLRRQTNGSEITRALCLALLNNRRLCNAVVDGVVEQLAESTGC
jgi:translation elongation factor EF-G